LDPQGLLHLGKLVRDLKKLRAAFIDLVSRNTQKLWHFTKSQSKFWIANCAIRSKNIQK